jgi:hypothetical protein
MTINKAQRQTLKLGGTSSQSPTNALDISCSPHKTYNYVKYIKI